MTRTTDDATARTGRRITTGYLGTRYSGTGYLGTGYLGRRAGLIALVLFTTGCAETTLRHGHHFRQTDLQQISPGMGQDQVRASLGTPTTTSPLKSGTAYYYISQTTKQQAFFSPNEVDRQVVAVYFTPTGSVERVAQYGIKDGKVFDTISRTTPSANTNDETVVQQLFRNLGKRGSVLGE